uniref:ARAD1B09592p n=1 Tax=Blastobotrys adeninivorans TaxID=409370 RepID=A0A060TAS8_BLAAD
MSGQLTTWLTKATGVRAPFIQGGMQWVGKAELVSAVANAGALGFVTAFTQPTPEALRNEIRKTKELTDKPFGVNFTLLPAINPPDYVSFATVAVEEGIRIFETSGNPSPIMKTLRSVKSVIIHKCVNLRHALKAQSLGVDAISIDGFECAGHPGEEDVTSLVLLTRCAQELKIPYIASGGFGDGRGAAAAFALGASGVNMGTRFLCTVEAPVHENVKKAIVEGKENNTSLLLKPLKNSVRAYRNKVSIAVEDIEKTNKNYKFEDVRELMAGKRGVKVYETGDVDYGIWSCGQVQGVIKDIPTCKDLVERLERETADIILGLPTKVQAKSKL